MFSLNGDDVYFIFCFQIAFKLNADNADLKQMVTDFPYLLVILLSVIVLFLK
jgi:hypothetical protein